MKIKIREYEIYGFSSMILRGITCYRCEICSNLNFLFDVIPVHDKYIIKTIIKTLKINIIYPKIIFTRIAILFKIMSKF